jgi:hypothetical protein
MSSSSVSWSQWSFPISFSRLWNWKTAMCTGSVTAANCKEIGCNPDVDGFLVGGASLKVWLNRSSILWDTSILYRVFWTMVVEMD